MFFHFWPFFHCRKATKMTQNSISIPSCAQTPKNPRKMSKTPPYSGLGAKPFLGPPAKADIATAILTNVIEHLVLLLPPNKHAFTAKAVWADFQTSIFFCLEYQAAVPVSPATSIANVSWQVSDECLRQPASVRYSTVSFKPVSVAPMNVGFDLIYQRPDHPCMCTVSDFQCSRNRFQGCFFSWNLAWISTSVREAMQTVSCRLNFPMLPRSQKSAYGNLSIWWLLPLHCGHCWSVDIWHPFSSQIWNHQ